MRLVAIASGKGGVGKTFLAASLAHALARRGRRVLLVDADLGLANLDVQLAVDAPHDLGCVLAGRIPLEAAVHLHPPTGIHLLVGRSGSGALEGLPPARLHRLTAALHQLARDFHLTLLDLAAGIGPACRHFARSSREILLVTSDEPTALTDAYAFIKTIAADRPLRLLVNGVDSHARGRETHLTLARACRRFLHRPLPLLGVVRRDPRIPQTIQQQKPLLDRFPQSPAATDILQLARRLDAPPHNPKATAR